MRCFVLVNGQKHGPYALEQVQAFLAQGQLTAETQVWPEGATAWMPLSQLPGISTGPAPGPEPLPAPEPIDAPPPINAAAPAGDAPPPPASSTGATEPAPMLLPPDGSPEAPSGLPQLLRSLWLPIALITLALLGWWWTTDSTIHLGASPGPGRPALILMHGHGAPAGDLVPLAEKLARRAPEVAFVLPPGTHRAGAGRAWWPSFSAPSREAYELRMVEELGETREEILELVQDLQDDGVEPADILVGGFSAGAILALNVVLAEGPGRQLGGLVFLSGSLRHQNLERLNGRQPMRVFASHGSSDSVLPIAEAKQLVAALEQQGHEVHWLEYAGAHRTTAEVAAELGEFLAGF